ncbi:AzlD domain-containing protein [Thermoleophilia bacterium SCSIO 60948]|nr:AzlD domain-containing protein [Thermoleophilia bacterium SCSIO 60948]
MSSAVWVTIIALAVTTALIRVSGPILLGGRELPPTAQRVVSLVAPALLAALVVVETLGQAAGSGLQLDERIAGVGVAALILTWRRSALLPAVAAAVVTTAVLRAVI